MANEPRHQLVITVLSGPDPINGHCTCDGWSARAQGWNEIGLRWTLHAVTEQADVALPAPGAAAAGLMQPYAAIRGSEEQESHSITLDLYAESFCEGCDGDIRREDGDVEAVEEWARSHAATHPGHRTVRELSTAYQVTRCPFCREEYGGLTGDEGALERWAGDHVRCMRGAAATAGDQGKEICPSD